MSKTQKKDDVTPMVKKDNSESFFSGQMMARLEDMERRFENMFSNGWLKSWWGKHSDDQMMMPFEGRMPRVDVIDKDNEVLINAELPGVKKADIDVSMNSQYVTIKGSTNAEVKEEKDDYYRSEISSGSFCRTVSLPCEVDVDHCEASFKDGLLELKMPKVETAKKKSIKIK